MYVQAIEELRTQGTRFFAPAGILVIDPGNPAPNAAWRRRIADASAALPDTSLFALVTRAVSARGALTAIHWMRPPRYEFTTHETFASAVRWVELKRGAEQPILLRLLVRARAGIDLPGATPPPPSVHRTTPPSSSVAAASSVSRSMPASRSPSTHDEPAPHSSRALGACRRQASPRAARHADQLAAAPRRRRPPLRARALRCHRHGRGTQASHSSAASPHRPATCRGSRLESIVGQPDGSFARGEAPRSPAAIPTELPHAGRARAGDRAIVDADGSGPGSADSSGSPAPPELAGARREPAVFVA